MFRLYSNFFRLKNICKPMKYIPQTICIKAKFGKKAPPSKVR